MLPHGHIVPSLCSESKRKSEQIIAFGVLHKIEVIELVDFDRLEALIKEQGKKKSYLCELIGKRRGYIADAKQGHGRISDEYLEVFAQELGTTAAYLRGETEEKSAKKEPAPTDGDGLTKTKLEFINRLLAVDDLDIQMLNNILDTIIARREG